MTSAIAIRNLPQDVHDRLRAIARTQGRSVESVARDALADYARRHSGGGVDFDRLDRVRRDLGVPDIENAWPPEMDDAALSRRVLGLEDASGNPIAKAWETPTVSPAARVREE